jgi:hypothetical protein
MSTNREKQVKAFEFLRKMFDAQTTFTAEQFQAETGFTRKSFQTYMSKQFRGLLRPLPSGNYRVSAVFRQFLTWPKFRDKVVTQNRNFARAYAPTTEDSVVIFEFYMPLRNEEYLRETLDSLFYKDTIKFRLNLIDRDELRAAFPEAAGEPLEHYLERVCQFVGGKFGGYSILHVSGRFRAAELMTQADGKRAERYLVDETTAVVRFIVPCRQEQERTPLQVADLVRWCFDKLFVTSILEVVNAEDQIWLVESGLRQRLHIWQAEQ